MPNNLISGIFKLKGKVFDSTKMRYLDSSDEGSLPGEGFNKPINEPTKLKIR